MGRRSAGLGAAGEEVAARYLEAAGFEILERNWRYTHGDVRGEVDLVAREGATLVICEVKARRGGATGGPLAAVTPRKLARLRRLAGAYAAGLDRVVDLRIDVVGVAWPPGGGSPRITHLRAVG